MPISDKPKAARMTSPEERAPLYAGYAASRQRGEDIGYRCEDDSIIQYAIRAYDREKYGTEALALPDWLVDLIARAQDAAKSLACDHPHPDWENGDNDPEDGPTANDYAAGCDRCAAQTLFDAVPERTKVLAEQGLALRSTASRPSLPTEETTS